MKLAVLLLALTIACAPAKALAPTAPPAVQQYAEAFCAANTVFLFEHTQMDGLAQSDIDRYFSGTPACTGVRYLGTLSDSGQDRYVFVFSYGTREDWVVFDFTNDSVTNFARG